ncbi:hypothetical protein FQA39_LY04238, partial [Lamprigera yunnana]
MPVKCAMCPKKNATLDDSNAVKCSKCGLLYHPSCAKRAKINADGWISFCCYSTAADEINEVNDLDENSRVLFKLIEAKFNGLEVKFNGLDSKIDNTLITVKEKLCELDDRVLKLEDNNVYLLENVISEINKRNSKECNCIIYKLEDSENAVKKDIELFKNLLACCNDEPSFNINDIKLIRLGKKFKSGVDRPLKVVFPNKDCLHWFFHNKKMIIEKSKKSIIITGDLTNAQRDFRNKVLSEIKLRREKDEDNLFMKYINGIPTIVKKTLQRISSAVQSVNKYLAQAIEARSIDREKSNHVNLLSLCFKDRQKENHYHDELDVGFSSSLVCALVVLVLLGGLQAVILPRTIILLLLFLTAFVWISVVLMLLLAVRLRWILWDISHSFVLRLAITVFTIVLVYTVAQVNVFTCSIYSPVNATMYGSVFERDHRACPLPQYIVLSCALGYLAVALFLRLPILLKVALLIIMSTVYILLIELSHFKLFFCYDEVINSGMSNIPAHVISVVEVLIFVIAVLIHGRQVEWTVRLDFLWQVQANEEKREMDALQHSNKRILFNLLPSHVATHFLDNQFRNNM